MENKPGGAHSPERNLEYGLVFAFCAYEPPVHINHAHYVLIYVVSKHRQEISDRGAWRDSEALKVPQYDPLVSEWQVRKPVPESDSVTTQESFFRAIKGL